MCIGAINPIFSRNFCLYNFIKMAQKFGRFDFSWEKLRTSVFRRIQPPWVFFLSQLGLKRCRSLKNRAPKNYWLWLSATVGQMGDRRGRLKRQSARVSGQGSQNLYSKLQFLRVLWWLFLWFGDSLRNKLSNYFVFCTKVMFLFTSIFYPNFYPLLLSRFSSITWL